MAVFVPGVARTVLHGYIGANPYVVVHHWRPGTSTAAWTMPDLTLLAAEIKTAWQAFMRAYQCTNTNIYQVDAMDIGSSTGLGTINAFAFVLGTRPGTLEPSSACTVVHNKIAARYRGGHPRTFWPGGSAAETADEAHWNSSWITNIANSVASFVGAVVATSYSFGAGTLNHVIPRYTYRIDNDSTHHKYTRTRIGVLSVDVVQSYDAMARIGSQRKRLIV